MFTLKTCFSPVTVCTLAPLRLFNILKTIYPNPNSKATIDLCIFLRKSLFSRCFYSNRCPNMSPNKKLRAESPLKIGTHSGRFHCDEVLGCFMLQILDKYKDAEIVRSRDLKILDTCDIVLDVGGVFDKDLNRFDHHQKTFNDTLSSLRPELGPKYDIRLSSAGLIYTYFGEEVISSILKNHKNITLSADSLKLLYRKIYENFIREIDAIDNGVPMCDGEPRYQITTHLGARVDAFNPTWNHEGPVDETLQFEKAKELVGNEFTDRVLSYATSWLPARKIVIEAIENSKKVYKTGEILELSQACPWKEHLAELEEEYNIVGLPKYILFCDRGDDWRVMCVPLEPKSFICRRFLHKDWRGLRTTEITKLSGIEGAEFCHSTGFIGGANSREGVFQMAVQSLKVDYVD